MNERKKWPERIGTRHTMKSGHTLTVTGYHRRRYSVRFDNGVEKTVTWQSIATGTASPKIREYNYDKQRQLGRTKMMESGFEGTIIRYENYADIDVQFFDGSIKTTTLERFNQGIVSTPSIRKMVRLQKSVNTIGRSRLQKYGETGIITGVDDNGKLEITFTNGNKAKGKTFNDYKKGVITSKENRKAAFQRREGTVAVSSLGQKAKLVKYISCRKVIIRFFDGTEKSVSWNNFITGHFAKENRGYSSVKRTDEQIKNIEGTVWEMNDGSKVRVLRYINSHNVWVVTSSGHVKLTTIGHVRDGCISDKKALKDRELPEDLEVKLPA